MMKKKHIDSQSENLLFLEFTSTYNYYGKGYAYLACCPGGLRTRTWYGWVP